MDPPSLTWNRLLPDLLEAVGGEGVMVRRPFRTGTDAYLVPSPGRRELVFAIPILLPGSLPCDPDIPPLSLAGAVHLIIERIKKESHHHPGLCPLAGPESGGDMWYAALYEPCTIASSPSRMATHLWRPDDQNRVVPGGIELLLRGTLPYRPPDTGHIPEIAGVLNRYADAVRDITRSLSSRSLDQAARVVWDQQDLRTRLTSLGLVSFISDGTRPARDITRHRCWYRVAGPKQGVHIPFTCPSALDPVEVEGAGTGATITGLGIRQREVFAITGANAEGKTSLLEAILSGEDDHAAGDGREHLVTVPGVVRVDATNRDIRGGDVSRFFTSLPPGMGGTVRSATGRGSGSLSMAFMIQEAIRRERSVIVIDEDAAAMNLLIPCSCTTEAVRPLSELVSQDRDWLGSTGLIIAGSAMEMLIARCDRILQLSGHQAEAIPPDQYRRELSAFYTRMGRILSDAGEDSDQTAA